MITDGFVLPEKDMPFDKRFDLNGCLLAFHSFLRNYHLGGKSFDLFFKGECVTYNVNPRIVLPFLQMGAGLLSRKQEPNAGILKRAMRLPWQWEWDRRGLERQLPDAMRLFRISYDMADLQEPVQLKDAVLIAKTKVSFAVLSYLGELGQSGYPDSGAFQYVRLFNQLGRFVRNYGVGG